MKAPVNRAIFSMAGLLILFAGSAAAGQITFTETLTASQPNAQGAFTVIDGVGVATAITGFPSLNGVDPSRFTLKVHLKELSLNFNPATGDFYSVQGKDPNFPYTTALFLDGVLVGSSSNARFISQGNVNHNIIGARSFGESLDVLTVTNPFYDDFLLQTGGLGGLVLALDEYNPAQPTGVFDVTGTITTSAVPEPASLALLGLGMAGLIACRSRSLAP